MPKPHTPREDHLCSICKGKGHNRRRCPQAPVEEVKFKVCSVCELNLPVEMFHRNARYKGGIMSCCKACKRDYNRNWHCRVNNLDPNRPLMEKHIAGAKGGNLIKERYGVEFYKRIRALSGTKRQKPEADE